MQFPAINFPAALTGGGEDNGEGRASSRRGRRLSPAFQFQGSVVHTLIALVDAGRACAEELQARPKTSPLNAGVTLGATYPLTRQNRPLHGQGNGLHGPLQKPC